MGVPGVVLLKAVKIYMSTCVAHTYDVVAIFWQAFHLISAPAV